MSHSQTTILLPRSYHDIWSDLSDCALDLDRVAREYLLTNSDEDPPQPQKVRAHLKRLIAKLEAIASERWESDPPTPSRDIEHER